MSTTTPATTRPSQNSVPEPAAELAAAPASVAELWSRLIESAENSAATGAALGACGPGELSAGRFELKLFNPDRESFVRTRMGEIEKLAGEITGHTVRIELVHAGAGEKPPHATGDEAGDPPTIEPPSAPTQAQIEQAMQNPLVQRTVEVFEGRVVRIEPVDDDALDREDPND